MGLWGGCDGSVDVCEGFLCVCDGSVGVWGGSVGAQWLCVVDLRSWLDTEAPKDLNTCLGSSLWSSPITQSSPRTVAPS